MCMLCVCLASPLHATSPLVYYPFTTKTQDASLPIKTSQQACVDAIIKASGVEEEEEIDDIEEEGEEVEDMGPETEDDK